MILQSVYSAGLMGYHSVKTKHSMKGSEVMLSIDEIKTTIAPIVRNYPVRRVILFGSYACGNATGESDMDIIIDSDGRLNAFDYFGIIGDIVKAVPVKVDVFELDEVKKPSKMLDSITNEGVVIYES